MTTHFLGILREERFSPGREHDDAAILTDVATALQQHGFRATVITPTAAIGKTLAPDTVVFTMSQGHEALTQMQQWSAAGVRIVNHPSAIFNCQRHRTVPLCVASGVAFPESLLIDTSPTQQFPRAQMHVPPWLQQEGAWLKRGDVHAMTAADVVRIETVPTFWECLTDFQARGIQRAVLQRHVPGTVYKFYGVGNGFFHCVPPDGHTLPPHDVLRGMAQLGAQAAAALGVEVYGGDCVHQPDGSLTLIDLNDWPSYARCRDAAAEAIAAYLLARESGTIP